jgi:hypothetical protein
VTAIGSGSYIKGWVAMSGEFLRIAAEWMELDALMIMLLEFIGVTRAFQDPFRHRLECWQTLNICKDWKVLKLSFLNDNQLSGSIPKEIGNLVNLEFL